MLELPSDPGIVRAPRWRQAATVIVIAAGTLLRGVPGVADLYAERTQGGLILDIRIDRESVARYGINLGDVQDIVETAVGGGNIGTVLDGRRSFPIRVCYTSSFSVQGVPAVSRRRCVPLGQIASLEVAPGPLMISSEDAQLRSVVLLNVRGRDIEK